MKLCVKCRWHTMSETHRCFLPAAPMDPVTGEFASCVEMRHPLNYICGMEGKAWEAKVPVIVGPSVAKMRAESAALLARLEGEDDDGGDGEGREGPEVPEVADEATEGKLLADGDGGGPGVVADPGGADVVVRGRLAGETAAGADVRPVVGGRRLSPQQGRVYEALRRLTKLNEGATSKEVAYAIGHEGTGPTIARLHELREMGLVEQPPTMWRRAPVSKVLGRMWRAL